MKQERKLLQLVRVGDIQRVYKHLHRCSKSAVPLVGRSKRLNVNFQLSNGRASLHFAAMSGNIDIIEMLVAQGADVDLPDCKNLRPLHYASAEGHTLAVHFLLSKGRSSANMPAMDGITPLHLACAHGHLDIVKLLLQHGADVWLTNVERYTPLDFAYLYRQPIVLSFLQQWLKVNAPLRKSIPSSQYSHSSTHSNSLLFPQGQPLPPWSPLSSVDSIPAPVPSDITVSSSCRPETSSSSSCSSIQLRHPSVVSRKEEDTVGSLWSGYQPHGQRPLSTFPNFDTIPSDAKLDRIRTTRPPSMSVTSSALSSHMKHPCSLSSATQPYLSMAQFPLHDSHVAQSRHSMSPNLVSSSSLRNQFSLPNYEAMKNGGQIYSLPPIPRLEEEDKELTQNRKDACFAVQARAIRSFAAGNIVFREGELITVLRQYDVTWWKGYVTAAGIEKAGLFPADAVQLLDSSRLPLPPVQDGSVDNLDVTSETHLGEVESSVQRLTPVLPPPALSYSKTDGSMDDDATEGEEEEDECPRCMEEEDEEMQRGANCTTMTPAEGSPASNSLSTPLPPSMAPLTRNSSAIHTTTSTVPSHGSAVSSSTASCSKCTGISQTSTCSHHQPQQQYRHSGASWDSGRGSAYASSVDTVPTISSAVVPPLSGPTVVPLYTSSGSMSTSVTSIKESNALTSHDQVDCRSALSFPQPAWMQQMNHRSRTSTTSSCECACHNGSQPPAHTTEDDANRLTFFLHSIGMIGHLEKIVRAGYDLFTLSRATPEDLTALGMTIPHERTKLKAAFQRGPPLLDPLPTRFPEDLCSLLWPLGLGEYQEVLHKQGYHDCLSLMELTWEDLEDLGVKRLGHLKKFGLLIERLKRLYNLLRNQNDAPLKLNPVRSSPTSQSSLESSGMATRTPSLRLAEPSHLYNVQTFTSMRSHPFCDEYETACVDRNYSLDFLHGHTSSHMLTETGHSQLPNSVSDSLEVAYQQAENRRDLDSIVNKFPSALQNTHTPSSLGMLNVISMLEDLEKKLDIHQSLGMHSSISNTKLSNIQN